MATIQADGVSSVTNTSTVNNGGTAKMNGSVSSGVVNPQSVATTPVGVFASTVVDNNNADPALSTGNFAYNNQHPVAKKVTSELSGVIANNFLVSGAADPSNRRSIHKLEVVRTRRLTSAIRDGRFNVSTGKFDAGFPVVAVDPFYDISSNTTSATSTDDAAAPTRAVPGELVYRTGAKMPVMDDYKKKTNWKIVYLRHHI